LGETLDTRLYDDSAGANVYIERKYNTAITTDQGTPHVYSTSYSGVVLATNIQLFRDGVQVDDTSGSGGTYIGMEDKAARLASYGKDSAGALTLQCKSRVFAVVVIAEQLTAAQQLAWARVLRSYVGISL
jgi:hypothetical protein